MVILAVLAALWLAATVLVVRQLWKIGLEKERLQALRDAELTATNGHRPRRPDLSRGVVRGRK